MAEKRRHKRQPMKLDVLCCKVGQPTQKLYKGCTVNVSTGGLLFESYTGPDVFQQGDLLKLDLSVPPTSGLLEFGGRISSFARVVRTSRLPDHVAQPACSANKSSVAVQFCRCPTLCQ